MIKYRLVYKCKYYAGLQSVNAYETFKTCLILAAIFSRL
jgi:hypothetical protein